MTVNVGLIGLGTVGGGVYELLKKRSGEIGSRVGCPLNLARACDLREGVRDDLGIPADVFTSDFNDVIGDESIDLVTVLTGNEEFAFECIKRSFEQGKHVVTANKALLARRWREVFTLARRHGRLIYFEASVGSGIPVIQGINEGLSANRIDRVKGILNGTTNFILTRMCRDGATLEDATEEAVRAGFAEVDSSSDISGLDAAHKLCVLANVISPAPVNFEDIHCEGISGLDREDIVFAENMFGFNIKLLAVLRRRDGGVEARVHPAFIPSDDMLSGVVNENNGILVDGDAVQDVMFYGKGAGRFPAASAVVSDITYLAQKIYHGIAGKIPYIHTDPESSTTVIGMNELCFQYYLRFNTADEPGVLSKISGILGEEGVSILSCFQKGRSDGDDVPIIMVTHRASEGLLKRALERIDELPVVRSRSVFIRIESDREIY